MARCMMCGSWRSSKIVGTDNLIKYKFYQPSQSTTNIFLCDTCWHNVCFGMGSEYRDFKEYGVHLLFIEGVERNNKERIAIKNTLLNQKYHKDINAQYWIAEIDAFHEAVKKEKVDREIEQGLRQEYIKEMTEEINQRIENFSKKYPKRVYSEDPALKHLSVARDEKNLVFIENNHPDFELQKWTRQHLRNKIHPEIKAMDDKEMFAVTTVPLSDIISFQLVGKVDRVTSTSGGGGGSIGPNIGGAIVGGLLFGGVGALLGAQAGAGVNVNPIQSTTTEYDTRKTLINLKNADGVAEIRELPFYYAEMLTKIIPEKEFSFLQAERNSSTAPVKEKPQNDNAIEAIKKFKELLDMGIITQEEFDAKKKQLLGL